ncbi:MAG: D-sedoheptulose 7-phosphate isomerase [candidate division KSB1 bacterium]|nr:D-sedoheptulose 7-phosphate isomerase [candidate division KSB1 bacterium]
MEKSLELVQNHLQKGADLRKTVSEQLSESILQAALVLSDCVENGGKLLICGNGGSAADAQHFAAEFVGRLQRNRPALPAVALSTDTSILTAVANDFSIEHVFKRQVEALGQSNDALVSISTSGNSKNVSRAVHAAKAKKMHTVALLGKSGGELLQLNDYSIVVPSDSSQLIQEIHISIIHMWCELIENIIYPL